MRVGIIGAGFAGLAAAYDLRRGGHEVVVFDGLPYAGGLAAGFTAQGWNWSLEHFYHHVFLSDEDILGLARETGFGPKILVRRPVTAQMVRGKPYALDGVIPVLMFEPIPLVDRVRMGLGVAYLKVTKNWRALESVRAEDWVRRWMGPAAYAELWEPLLMGKFGAAYRDVPMSWLWARLHARTPRLGYFEGGFQAFADHLAGVVTRQGAELRLGTAVRRISWGEHGSSAVGKPPAAAKNALVQGLAIHTDAGAEAFDRVIATVGPHLFARLVPDLPPEYLGELNRLPYLGAIVAVLAMDRQLMERVYWLGVDKREFPFLACVEHTNFMPAEHYGGDRLVYVGDYLPIDHRYFAMSDDELLAEWLPALKRINPEFDASWVRRSWVGRSTYAQPVVPMGFGKHIPPLATPVPGLYLASMSQVYPWDRGTNFAVEIGRRVAKAAVA